MALTRKELEREILTMIPCGGPLYLIDIAEDLNVSQGDVRLAISRIGARFNLLLHVHNSADHHRVVQIPRPLWAAIRDEAQDYWRAREQALDAGPASG